MRISFHGAAGGVTGSCNLVEGSEIKLLVDCGMFQGDQETEEKNEIEFNFDPEQLDAVIVTHAHLDHVGRLPLLVQAGYKGEIYTTPATANLAKLILEDALVVMQENYRRFGNPVLYNEDEVARTIEMFHTIEYNTTTLLGKQQDVQFTYHDAGHIFGSAFVELNIEGKKIIFSGDVGNTDVPILKDTEVMPDNVDLVVCESTYGGRIHIAKTNEEREGIIEEKLGHAIKRGGVIMIPSFALERTQQLLYVLNELFDRKKVFKRIPIYLDSPLAIHATEVYRQYPRYYNAEAKQLYSADKDLFSFPGLTVCENTEQSKQINDTKGAKIIIAGAGMMNGGRIIHHAKRYLSYIENTLLFIGYQARGTLGRKILEGMHMVKILKDKIPVKCHVEAIGALSAHADQNKILDWLGGGKILPKQICFNHGEVDQAQAVAKRIEDELGVETKIASEEMVIEL